MRKKIAAILLFAALLPACSFLQTNHEKPVPELPDQWKTTGEGKQASDAGERWWMLFDDPVLDKLVDEALQHNHDIEAAAARILEAEAALGVTEADRYPIVTAGGNGSRTGSSEATAVQQPGIPRVQNNVRVTLNASYELDVWGKFRRASDAARAQLLAAESARDTVRLTLTADVAQQYFNLLAADAQVEVIRDVLKTRADSLGLLRLRGESGLVSEYEIRQAEAEEAAARSQLAAALRAQENLQSVLAILLGRSPREVMDGQVERGNVATTQAVWVPDGLPSDLLLRRPDIREAEQNLLAQDARIDAARAEFFPAISLTAYVGSESATLANLFSGPAGIFQFALGLAQPIFNAGRLTFSVKAAEARREQAVAAYKKAVASAFGDVRTALNNQTAARATLQAESERIVALVDARRLANMRYEGGVSSRLEVLDADRQLLQAQLARVDAENAQRAAVVGLFKALGGGWAAESEAAAP
ncbi:MAG TPA: efflux transporter outer membrane subunit [Methylophilaceae bacterium]|jgi:multidrug efflux system outer membrane protein|nr:efflux transporter outer membrane subunit [Methylophilaceae bacterium]